MLAVGLSCMCMLSCFSHVQLFVTHWTVACQAPLSVGLSRQECWSELPCPPPGDLPNPDIKPRSPALHVDSLSSELQVYQIHHAVYLKYKQFSFYKLYYKIGARKLGLGPRGWVWFLQGPRSFSLIFSKSELFLWCP